MMNAQTLNDEQLIMHFDAAALSHFTHSEHIRVTWLILQRRGWQAGLATLRAGLRRLAEAHGHPEKYHETLTCFWAEQVWQAMQNTPAVPFAAFAATTPHLFDKSLVKQFYSAEVLNSEQARREWVHPELSQG